MFAQFCSPVQGVQVSLADRLHENTVKQWEILEARLALPNQKYIALRDRPTIADLSYFPFAMPWMFKFLDVDIKRYPHIYPGLVRDPMGGASSIAFVSLHFFLI